MNNYFNLKTIINRNVLYLQQRVDNGIIVNTPPQLFVDNQSVTQQAYFIKTMKKVALLIAATFLLLTLAILPVKVKGQIYKKVTQSDINSEGWSWAGTYLIVSGSKVMTGYGGGAYGGSADITILHNDTYGDYIEGDHSYYQVSITSGSSSGRIWHNRDGYLKYTDARKLSFDKSAGTDWTFAADRIGVSGSSTKFLGLQNQSGQYKFVGTVYTADAKAILYKKLPSTQDITGAGEASEGNDKYYLIASPIINNYTPTQDNGFLRADGDYDLYYFDQSNNDEWRNYKVSSFNMTSGKGYLYASKEDTELTFDGVRYYGYYAGNNYVYGKCVVNLAYTAGKKLAGWNLIGNPFDVTAYLTDGRDFLRMNPAGDGFIASSGSINAMEGVFVQATGTGQSVTFTITAPSSKDEQNESVALNLIGNDDNVIDRAIVRFGEGGTLSKLTLKENSTKIYIPQEDGDFAVVRSNGKENIPVNFKASKIGRYTISVETEGVNMKYLHLIDRLTGKDTDLLIENKYSFIASQSDIESRFILSFGNNGYESSTDGTFAYQNGSDVVVRGEGELQVFDVMGRMVMQQCVNGEEIVSVQSQGVYVFRLNGKTQKIVVR